MLARCSGLVSATLASVDSMSSRTLSRCAAFESCSYATRSALLSAEYWRTQVFAYSTILRCLVDSFSPVAARSSAVRTSSEFQPDGRSRQNPDMGPRSAHLVRPTEPSALRIIRPPGLSMDVRISVVSAGQKLRSSSVRSRRAGGVGWLATSPVCSVPIAPRCALPASATTPAASPLPPRKPSSVPSTATAAWVG